MDVRELPRHDLAILAAAVAPHRRAFVSMIFAAIVDERGLDLQVERDDGSYVLVATETVGDAIVGERRLPIVWDALDEDVRLLILRVHFDGLVEGHRRWMRRMAPRLAALVIAPVPSPTSAANDY